jgi:Integrase core domain
VSHIPTSKLIEIFDIDLNKDPDLLDAYLFEDLEEVKMISDEWQQNYNHYYPHDALNGTRPAEWKSKELQPRFATTIEREHKDHDEQQNTQSFL